MGIICSCVWMCVFFCFVFFKDMTKCKCVWWIKTCRSGMRWWSVGVDQHQHMDYTSTLLQCIAASFPLIPPTDMPHTGRKKRERRPASVLLFWSPHNSSSTARWHNASATSVSHSALFSPLLISSPSPLTSLPLLPEWGKRWPSALAPLISAGDSWERKRCKRELWVDAASCYSFFWMPSSSNH